ncbi:hypothetical protein ACPA54_15930 [Uniformispora flossi]|uniref:hypothetical protein n=1 Tax=Uniformispora flossi TaxID=3390723 RepID=UPI003C2C5681
MTCRDRRIPFRFSAAVGGVVVALAAAACTSDSGGSGGRISVEEFEGKAKSVTAGAPCPFAFDVARALKTVGANRPVVPDSPPAEGGSSPAEPAQPARPSGPTSPAMPAIPAVPARSSISCSYLVGDADLSLTVIASPAAKTAQNFALPLLMHDGGMAMDQATTFVSTLLPPGSARVTPGAGTAAFYRVPVSGDGDIGLVVGVEGHDDADAPLPDLTGAHLETLAMELGKAVKG